MIICFIKGFFIILLKYLLKFYLYNFNLLLRVFGKMLMNVNMLSLYVELLFLK